MVNIFKPTLKRVLVQSIIYGTFTVLESIYCSCIVRRKKRTGNYGVRNCIQSHRNQTRVNWTFQNWIPRTVSFASNSTGAVRQSAISPVPSTPSFQFKPFIRHIFWMSNWVTLFCNFTYKSLLLFAFLQLPSSQLASNGIDVHRPCLHDPLHALIVWSALILHPNWL